MLSLTTLLIAFLPAAVQNFFYLVCFNSTFRLSINNLQLTEKKPEIFVLIFSFSPLVSRMKFVLLFFVLLCGHERDARASGGTLCRAGTDIILCFASQDILTTCFKNLILQIKLKLKNKKIFLFF
jgi:hypothetical protein